MKPKTRSARSSFLVILTLIAGMMMIGSYAPSATAAACPGGPGSKTLTANVVAIDQPIMFNRLGAQNVNYMMYALERDVVVSNKPSNSSSSGSGYPDGKPISQILYETDQNGEYVLDDEGRKAARGMLKGNVALRPDKRPRPIVLRVAAGDCLEVNLTNLLQQDANPFNGPVNPNNCQVGAPGDGPADLTDPTGPTECEVLLNINDQVAGRQVSFHPLGMQLVGNIDDTGSNVGLNNSSLVDTGQSAKYTYFAESENAYMVYSRGQPLGGEASGGNIGVGLFGVVNVEPKRARFYRSQVTEEEMRLATKKDDSGYPKKTPPDDDGYWGEQPIIDYEARYPNEEPWKSEGKANLPILNMVDNGEIVHSDINAIIAGTKNDGSFLPDTYPLEGVELRNPVLPNRLEAFREFTVVFHDEQAATQAFPKWFGHPVTGHTLHGVRDSFMINYGSGGIGSEIIANRLRVGPMWDCLNCAYEEFFLSSYTVGDPAMLVDVPANANLELCGPDELASAPADLATLEDNDPDDPTTFENDVVNECINLDAIGIGGADPTATHGIKATQAFYPDDPSNVHHSYKRDFVKFRNLHAGPKEQHIFHLHNHQWLFNPNDDNSNYIDAQGIGPGSGYTLEIAQGGAGNRNLSAGDAIFHCHFYPHFAQGMWEHWRINDVYQTGTELAVSTNHPYNGDDNDNGGNGNGIHDTPFALQNGLPAVGARAYPDGEILAGTPIPAIVPLPGVALPPMPGAKVTVELKGAPATASVAKVHRDANGLDPDTGKPIGNPGYPFWIAGIEDTVGQRSTTPPLDMLAMADGDPSTFDAGDLVARCSATGEDRDPSDFFTVKDEYGNDIEKCLWSHPGLDAGAGGHDGGLPRHALEGYLQGGLSVNVQNRLDFTKVIEQAKPVYYPEEGTDLEKRVMAFNAVPFYDSSILLMNGTASDTYPDDGKPVKFQTNGQLPVPSAPFYEPCRDDQANLFETGAPGQFWNAENLGQRAGFYPSPEAVFGADAPRVYKGANIQIDAVLNKVGYHYPQQRIIALWEDVMPTIDKTRAPEPLVMRSNTFDCVKYLHANLVPEYFELDDYQVRTPTDIIGQHIHLPKWDLVANDGSGNGWNYEDGTLSPGMVRERIHAINAWNAIAAAPVLSGKEDLNGELHEKEHPFFGPGPNQGAQNWLGARTTIQRWFTDPVVNTELVDRGLGIVFTHDHYGPSTHQQVGLYSTILAEPYGSMWKHNETGEPMYTRADGGPTSWQAIVEPTVTGSAGLPGSAEPFREFYFEFGDFQHAYEAGTYVGIGNDGDLTALKDPVTHSPVTGAGNILHLTAIGMDVVLTDPVAPDGEGGIPAGETFQTAINPSVRQEPKDQQDVFPDIARFPPWCPGTDVQGGLPVPGGAFVPRPCAEAISADDVGLIAVNYRTEPVGLRVFDPNKDGPDGNKGTQAGGLAGDLAYALQTRTDRAIPEMNVQPTAATNINGTKFPPPINTGAVEPGDPFTPLLRTYPGDLVKVKIQAGSTEHEHNAIIHGVKWRQAGSGHGQAPNSGWRNAQNDGISEQFTFNLPLGSDPQKVGTITDYAYSVDASQDGWWTGTWGIMRSYDELQGDLVTLSSNPDPKPGRIINAEAEFNGVCPLFGPDGTTPTTVRKYTVVAMTANQLLGNALNLTLDTNEGAGPAGSGFASEDHVGARPVQEGGGTLVYNNRPGGDMRALNDTQGGPRNSKALHDPTALLYVNVDDLQEVGAHLPGYKKSRQCNDSKGVPGVLRDGCEVELKPSAPIEPVAIRGAAGDCIEVTLYNKLPPVAPDLAGYNTLLQMVNRRVDNTNSLLTFNNNLIKPSSHVGLHPQLVEFDASQDDGANVGLNQVQTVGPVNPDGSLDKAHTYRWYAGHLSTRVATTADCQTYGVRGKGCGQGNDVVLLAEPVELGGFNLNPADKIKQGQKGLVGAGVVLPRGATWNEDVASLEQVMDHQVAGKAAERGTRLSMEVDNSGVPLKDVALVFQKGTNQRFSDASAIPNLAAEGQGVPEDSHDAGQMAISYGTEPLWYRFNLRADEPFGNAQEGLGAVANSHDAFSNKLAGVNGDPVTPVVTANAKQDVRIRLLMPTGSGRGTTFVLDNHAWQRDPYICEDKGGVAKDGLSGRCATTEAAAPTKIGHNPIGFVIGHQESVTPGAHFDVVPLHGAGGINGIPGDHLYADQGSFGPTSGLWGILRVKEPPPQE